MLGNCAVGKLNMATKPTMTMTMEITMDITGWLMKNLAMIVGYGLALSAFPCPRELAW